ACAPARLAGVQVEHAAHELQVLEPAQPLVDRGVLAGQADPRPGATGVGDDVDPVDERAPLVRLEQRGEDPHGRGLARAVRPQHAEDRGALDLEVHPPQGDGVPEPLGESFRDDSWHGFSAYGPTGSRTHSSVRSWLTAPARKADSRGTITSSHTDTHVSQRTPSGASSVFSCSSIADPGARSGHDRDQNSSPHASAQTVPWFAPARVTTSATFPAQVPKRMHHRVEMAPIECATTLTRSAPVRASRSSTVRPRNAAVVRFGWQVS